MEERESIYYSWKRMDQEECHMSQEILNSVLRLNLKQRRWKEKFDEKLSETKAATDPKSE